MEDKIFETAFGKKTATRLSDVENLTLGKALSIMNEGFWEGLTDGLKELPVYWGATMLVGVGIWAWLKHESKKTGKDN